MPNVVLFDEIKEIHVTPFTDSKRMDVIADFFFHPLGNREFRQNNAIFAVRHLAALVDQAVFQSPNLVGEVGSILISFSNEKLEIRNRYWGVQQVAAFKAVIYALAPLYGWKVNEITP